MKSFKDYVTMNESATITLPKAKNDQEIHDRLKLLKDAGIEAQSGGRSAHTDINVSSKDVAKAKKLLGLNEKDLEDEVELKESSKIRSKLIELNKDREGKTAIGADGSEMRNSVYLGNGSAAQLRGVEGIVITQYDFGTDKFHETKLTNKQVKWIAKL